MAEQSSIGGDGSIGPIGKRNYVMLQKIEKRLAASGTWSVFDFSWREVASARGLRRCPLTDGHNDDGWHLFRERVVLLDERHQRKMPAVENIQDRIRFSRGLVIVRQ